MCISLGSSKIFKAWNGNGPSNLHGNGNEATFVFVDTCHEANDHLILLTITMATQPQLSRVRVVSHM